MYNRSNGFFRVGNRLVSAGRVGDNYLALATKPDDVPAITDTPPVASGWSLVVCPPMVEWMKDGFNEQVEQDALNAMHDAWRRFGGELPRRKRDLDKLYGGFMGFRATRRGSETPNLPIIGALGNCACLGPDLHGWSGGEDAKRGTLSMLCII